MNPLACVERGEAGDSSNSMLEKGIPGFKQVLDDALTKKRWEIFYTDQEENNAITTTLNSMGLTDTVALIEFLTLFHCL